MKVIEYRTTIESPDQLYFIHTTVSRTRNINTGAVKALARALKDLPAGHEFVSIEFWEVKS